MSISITITDPTDEEALRIADYLYDIAGYGKSIRDLTPAESSAALKTHVESLTAEPHESTGGEGSASDIDSAGMKWDERIHASSRAVVKDGTWRMRKNLDRAYIDSVLAEIRAVGIMGSNQTSSVIDDVGLPAPAPGAWPFPPAVDAPPAAFIPIPPTFMSADVAPPITFAALMKFTSAAVAAGTIDPQTIIAAVRAEGVESLPLLATSHAHLIPAVAKRLGAI